MDRDFETELLGMIDDFLASNKDYAAFEALRDTLPPLYAERSNEVIAPVTRGRAFLEPLSPADSREFHRLADELLPRDRAEFFDRVAERMSYTLDYEPDASGRRYGYGTLEEFIGYVRRDRELYRRKFENADSAGS